MVTLFSCKLCSFIYAVREGDNMMVTTHKAGGSPFVCKGSGLIGVPLGSRPTIVEFIDDFADTCWEGPLDRIPAVGENVEYDHDDDGVCNREGVVRSVTHNVNTGHVTVALETKR